MTVRYTKTPEGLAAAAELLASGQLVAFPTETVYGLGADARNPQAVRRVFKAKGRPADHPLIVHIADAQEMTRWAKEIPDSAWLLAEQFWPGPLTLILKRADAVLDEVTGGQETVGLRVPDHPVALALLRAFGDGVAAPSANRFGRISPTTADHVLEELSGVIEAVVDGGSCDVGIESTILDLSGTLPRILRPGKITAAQLAHIIPIDSAPLQAGTPRVSGSLEAHYAPTTPLKMYPASRLEAALTTLSHQGCSVTLLSSQASVLPVSHWLAMPKEVETYARLLYARLREADALGSNLIVLEEPPTEGVWNAIRDRLKRAMAGSAQ